jgi:hypothetical protein
MNTNINLADKVAEKIKKSEWGDFIDEADLYELVKTSLHRVFFEKRTETVNNGSYNKTVIETIPAIDEVVKQKFEAIIKQQAEKWFTENQDKLLEKWQAVFDEGVMTYALRLQENLITAHIRDMVNKSIGVFNNAQYEKNCRNPDPNGYSPPMIPNI